MYYINVALYTIEGDHPYMSLHHDKTYVSRPVPRRKKGLDSIYNKHYLGGGGYACFHRLPLSSTIHFWLAFAKSGCVLKQISSRLHSPM